MRRFAFAGLSAFAALSPATGFADPPDAAAGQQSASPADPGFTTQLFASSRTNLLGDMFGLRSWAQQYGLSIGLQDTEEVLGNVTGGVHTGFAYDGQTMLSIGLDTQKAFGWEGGTFNASFFQIRGRNLSTDNLYTLQTASGIEAMPSTRLWELWFQQTLLNGRMDVKIGQQSIDQEFISSAGASTFINTMMGWPVVPSYDLYAGGPAYPLSSLGVRLRGQPADGVTLLGGVYDDNPPGGPFNNDPQTRQRERYGAQFNLNTGALFIAEADFAINQPSEGQLVSASGGSHGLPGTYKVGAWFDTASFPDPRIDNSGLSLADPNSTGIPRQHLHNYSIYGVADQTVWRPDPDGQTMVNLFARIMGAPGDRNLISFGLNAGVVLKAPLPGRDSDTFGIGYGLAKVSGSASQLDNDVNFFTGAGIPVRSSESFIELTYQYQIAPWWSAQPDFQYVFNPGAGIPNPLNPPTPIRNEAVFGLRTVLTF